MSNPYYDADGVTLYHGDCLELWPVLMDRMMNDLDMHGWEWTMVTDPPYGMAYQSNKPQTGSTAPIVGDTDTRLRDEVLARWGDAPALCFGTWRMPRPTNVRELLVWDKGLMPGMGNLTMPWGPAHEDIYVLGNDWAKPDHVKRAANVVRFPTMTANDADRPNHPTPKPIPLMEHLIERCPGDVIFDPFAGSGSTLRAAMNLGRRAVGVELDEGYCELIVSRLGQMVLPW